MSSPSKIITPGEWVTAKWTWFWNKDRTWKENLLFRVIPANPEKFNQALANYTSKISDNEKVKLKAFCDAGQVQVFEPNRASILEAPKEFFE